MPPPPPPPKWTRRFPLPVLIGHVASLTAGGNRISGSPFAVEARPAEAAAASAASGEGLARGDAGEPGTFAIEARDRFGNALRPRPGAPAPFTASAAPAGAAPSEVGPRVSLADRLDGTFTGA